MNKFRLTQGIGYDGITPFFRIYEWKDDRWTYINSHLEIENARKQIGSLRNPQDEIVLEEFEA